MERGSYVTVPPAPVLDIDEEYEWMAADKADFEIFDDTVVTYHCYVYAPPTPQTAVTLTFRDFDSGAQVRSQVTVICEIGDEIDISSYMEKNSLNTKYKAYLNRGYSLTINPEKVTVTENGQSFIISCLFEKP